MARKLLQIVFTFYISLISEYTLGQQFFSDIALNIGARYNSAITYEKYSRPTINGDNYFIRYNSFERNWKPSIGIQTSIVQFEIKKQKKERSLHFKINIGVNYHQVYRDHSFTDISVNNNYITNYDDHLKYSSRSHNLGFNLGFIFIKKWSPLFEFEYGLSYRTDIALAPKITYHRTPKNHEWETLSFPNSDKLKNQFNHEIYLELTTIFNLNSHFATGLSFKMPTWFLSSYIFDKSYPIIGTANNFLNRSIFTNVIVKYTF